MGDLILKEYVVDKSNIKKTRFGQNGKIIRITTKDGKIINVASAREERDRIVGYEYSPIPLSEIDIIWVKKANVLATLGVILLGVVAFNFVAFALGGFKLDLDLWGNELVGVR